MKCHRFPIRLGLTTLILLGMSIAQLAVADHIVQDLGTLGAGGESSATGINQKGQVVGWSHTTSALTQIHAFLWLPAPDYGYPTAGMKDLGTLGGVLSQAAGINDKGQVVGISYTAGNAATHGFLWLPAPDYGYPTAGMKDLGSLYPTGLNNKGQVAGYFYPSGSAFVHAFLWTPTGNGQGTMQDLGALSGNPRFAYGLNNHGHVVGYSAIKDQTAPHAFLWTVDGIDGYPGSLPGEDPSIAPNPQMKDLGTLDPRTGNNPDTGEPINHSFSIAQGINDLGQVVGVSQIVPNAQGQVYSHAFLWTPSPSPPADNKWKTRTGAMIDLGTLGGDYSYAYGINAQGQVVGYSYLAGNAAHAFLWLPASAYGYMTAGMKHLSTLSGDYSIALGINANGWVVGFSYLSNNQRHACLWKPVVTVAGKITLQDCVNSAQPLTFTFYPADNSASFERSVTPTANGDFSFVDIPSNSYTVHIKGAKWLAANVAVNTMSGNANDVTATLLAGDADNNNVVDFDDLTILAIAYNTATGDPLFDDRADFNCDGQVEFADLTLLAINYNVNGAP